MKLTDPRLAERIASGGTTRGGAFGLRLVVLGVLIGFLYYDILARLATDWWIDPNFSHGFLVPVFSGFVVWQDRKQLAALPQKPSWFGLAVIAGALVVLIVGVLGAEFFLSRSSLVLLIGGLVICFLGWGHFRAILFPLAFLFFMIPIPVIVFNQIAFPGRPPREFPPGPLRRSGPAGGQRYPIAHHGARGSASVQRHSLPDVSRRARSHLRIFSGNPKFSPRDSGAGCDSHRNSGQWAACDGDGHAGILLGSG